MHRKDGAMLITDLQNRLRVLVRERIASGELTGTELANRAGFQQAHVSNFLNGRRGLSIEAMDRVMEVLGLEVGDLMVEERRKRMAAGGDPVFDSIPVVQAGALLQSDFGSGDIVELLRFKKSFLRRIRAEMANERGSWQRFVLIKADRESGVAMRPRLAPGAMLLIDRHYNSLRSYRRNEPNLYVVKSGTAWQVRYAELQGCHLTLRPENQECGLGYLQPGKGETFADYIVGRVAHIAIET
jgi:transcriptional regulator with XRE-family HTH domain